eukprot:209540_1
MQLYRLYVSTSCGSIYIFFQNHIRYALCHHSGAPEFAHFADNTKYMVCDSEGNISHREPYPAVFKDSFLLKYGEVCSACILTPDDHKDSPEGKESQNDYADPHGFVLIDNFDAVSESSSFNESSGHADSQDTAPITQHPTAGYNTDTTDNRPVPEQHIANDVMDDHVETTDNNS